MKVIPFSDEYLDAVHEIQQQAYFPLFQKYHDAETNPYLEAKDVVRRKYHRPGTFGYVFLEENVPVGAVRVISKDDVCKISALAVLPQYQNCGIAQTALKEIEAIHSHTKIWVLDTLMQEPGNCHLYEKLGYLQTGKTEVINDNLTLIFYRKERMCTFCKIISGELPSMKVYEDEFTLVFMDIAEDVDGHMVAVPKKHVENIFDCDTETLHHLMDTIKLIADNCAKRFGYDGVNLLHASGACSGQSVPHFHIHLIPRKSGDGINAWPSFSGSTIPTETLWKQLRLK